MFTSMKRSDAGTFDAVVHGVGERLLSGRTFDLVLAPALADYQIERRCGERSWTGRLAVLVALSGALRMEAANNAANFFMLALLPFCYDVVLLTMFSDFFDMSGGVRFIAVMMLVLSFIPVVVCFWPERPVARN